MKVQKKSYVGAAVFLERLADDGRTEDASRWTERTGGCTLGTVHGSEDRVQGVRRPLFSQFIKSLLRSHNSE
jgi:hypothetical protein